MSPSPGQTTVSLPRCRWWQTNELGHLTKVRCPDHDHCLHMVALINGRISEHDRNIDGHCLWIGIRVVDDRSSTRRVNPHG